MSQNALLLSFFQTYLKMLKSVLSTPVIPKQVVGQIWPVGCSLPTSGLYSIFKGSEYLSQSKQIQLFSPRSEILPLLEEGKLALYARKGRSEGLFKSEILGGEESRRYNFSMN